MPKRIQRRRTKGWRMPTGAVYVGRPTIWGNPFRLGTRSALARVPALDGSPWEYEGRISADGMQHDYFHGDGTRTIHHIRYMTAAECVDVYRAALTQPTQSLRLHVGNGQFLSVRDVVEHLAGKDLVCWCPTWEPCHADVLLAVANAPAAVPA